MQNLREALETLRPTGLHTVEILSGHSCRFDHARLQRELRLAVVVVKSDGVEHFEHRLPIVVQRSGREYPPLRLDDLVENAGHGIDGALRSAHVDADYAARPDIHFAD